MTTILSVYVVRMFTEVLLIAVTSVSQVVSDMHQMMCIVIKCFM